MVKVNKPTPPMLVNNTVLQKATPQQNSTAAAAPAATSTPFFESEEAADAELTRKLAEAQPKSVETPQPKSVETAQPKPVETPEGPFGPFARISKLQIREKMPPDGASKLVFNFDRGLEFNEIPVDQVQEACRFLLNSDKAKEAETKGEMVWLSMSSFKSCFRLQAKVYCVGSLHGIHIDDESKICDGHALKIRHEKQKSVEAPQPKSDEVEQPVETAQLKPDEVELPVETAQLKPDEPVETPQPATPLEGSIQRFYGFATWPEGEKGTIEVKQFPRTQNIAALPLCDGLSSDAVKLNKQIRAEADREIKKLNEKYDDNFSRLAIITVKTERSFELA